jgi:FMN phosphatase YigB (HAD superfamily)
MAENKDLFLDYGELIFDHRFNDETLSRAHGLALDPIHQRGYTRVDMGELSRAHQKVIGEYLAARKADNTEWPMAKIIGKIVGQLGLDRNLVPNLVDIYKRNDHDYWPMKTTVASLPVLARDRKIHIISNTPHDSLVNELAEYGLAHFFRTITLSCDVGFRKPQLEIYQAAMKNAKSTPKTSLFVSHDEIEVEGARQVGMESFLAKSLVDIVEALQ